MSKTFGFSVLSNDVDLDDRLIKRPLKEKNAKPEPEPVRKPIVKPNPKTLKKKQEKESLQALAFGKPATKKKAASAPTSAKTTSSSTAKKAKSNGANCNGIGPHSKEKPLSEDWKNRDQQFVEEENERELREALMLSKLDYEANKDLYQQPPDLASAVAKAKKKKKDKPITISLSEFNTLDTRKLSNLNGNEVDGHSSLGAKQVRKSSSGDDNFFADVDQAVRTTIIKENRQKQYAELNEKQKTSKKQQQPKSNGAPLPTSGAGVLVPIAEVEKRDFEIQALRLELESLREQLEKVKIRNKKLCEVLGTAEMRQLGEVVVELDKVRRARDEFSAEVTTLSEQLEQEKTKVSQLQDKCRKK